MHKFADIEVTVNNYRSFYFCKNYSYCSDCLRCFPECTQDISYKKYLIVQLTLLAENVAKIKHFNIDKSINEWLKYKIDKYTRIEEEIDILSSLGTDIQICIWQMLESR